MRTLSHPPLTLLPDLTGGRDSHSPLEFRFPVFDDLRRALAEYLDMPGEVERWSRLVTVRRVASAAIARWPRKHSQTSHIHVVHELVREMSKSGVHDHLAAAEDLVQATEYARKGWQGVLAAMLLVPAWQWPEAPMLMEVPVWLRPDYVRWLFAAPQNFTVVGQTKSYATFQLNRLEELMRWMKRGPAEEEELKVLGAYASHCSLSQAACGWGDLRRHTELRGHLLLRAMGRREDSYQAQPKSRTGRKLRIGIIHRHFDSQPEIYATLPLFEQLDPERFEVVLFTYVNNFSQLEGYCRQKSADMLVLPAALPSQLELLRSARLDVAVFSTNLTAECNVVTRLALHRVAPLQVATNATEITSGLPEIDLHLSGSLAATEGSSAQFTERLALLPGPTHHFNFEADRAEASLACTRADFGLPEDAFVFVSTADFRKIIPEVQQAWARLLAAVPGTYLLVHPFHQQEPSGHTVYHFYTEFEEALKREGVNSARLVVSTVTFPSRTELQCLVGLGDAYLDTFPVSVVDSLVDPLALGLPVVGWEGDTLRSRTGGSLLRTLGLEELIANSPDAYQAIAVKLAGDPLYWESCRTRIRAELAKGPAYLDSLKASQAFGRLMETAIDELAAQDRTAFRAKRQPVSAPAPTPAQLKVESIVGKLRSLRLAPGDVA